MRKFDLIVFDLDGTVFDTKQSLLNTVRYVIQNEGLHQVSDETVKSFIGPPLEYSFKAAYPEIPQQELTRLIKVFRTHYKNVELFNTKLYDGIEDVFIKLKEENYKIALATYKAEDCAKMLFEHFNLTKYFDSIKGAIENLNYTKVDIINRAIKECAISDLNKICMIGDTEHDFRGAIHVGIYFIGMTYGFEFSGLTDEEKKYKNFIDYCDKAEEILKFV